jgi:hypothetical protein
MDKKCDQSGMRNYVEGQVNRNPKTASSILFAMMNQYVHEDTDVEGRKSSPTVWTKNMPMKRAAISRRKSTGILRMNASRNFLAISTRRIFDRERRTLPHLKTNLDDGNN